MSISIVALLLAGAPAPPPPSPVHNAQPAGQAATANTPPPPAPAFQIEPFRFLVAHWRGKGMFFNGTPVMSSMTFELINRTTMMVRATEDAPNTYRYAALWSREKGSGELLMLLSSSSTARRSITAPAGSAIALSSSPEGGSRQDRAAFVSPMRERMSEASS